MHAPARELGSQVAQLVMEPASNQSCTPQPESWGAKLHSWSWSQLLINYARPSQRAGEPSCTVGHGANFQSIMHAPARELGSQVAQLVMEPTFSQSRTPQPESWGAKLHSWSWSQLLINHARPSQRAGEPSCTVGHGANFQSIMQAAV